jgi:WD40 repeat protein
LLISASGDKSARLWDGKSGVFKKTLPGPTEWQYAVALSQDGRLAAAGGWDGLVRVWSTDKGTLLATLIQPPSESPGQAEWLAASPAGFLNASPGLLPLIRWRVGGADLSGDAASSAFLRPDQVAHFLAGEPTAALESVLKPKDAPQ